MRGWLLFKATWVIIQLYHSEENIQWDDNYVPFVLDEHTHFGIL